MTLASITFVENDAGDSFSALYPFTVFDPRGLESDATTAPDPDRTPMNFFFSPTLTIAWFCLVWILTAIVHVAFAAAVYFDSELLWKHLRRKTFFVGGLLWALATLLGGVFVAAIYWVIHHSTLCARLPRRSESKPGESKPSAPGASAG